MVITNIKTVVTIQFCIRFYFIINISNFFIFLNLSIFNSNPHPFYISEYEFFEKIKALKTKVELSDRKNN